MRFNEEDNVQSQDLLYFFAGASDQHNDESLSYAIVDLRLEGSDT